MIPNGFVGAGFTSQVSGYEIHVYKPALIQWVMSYKISVEM